MLVNHEQIHEGFIQHIREVLDGLLSEMPSTLGSMPSVIKDRTGAPRPDFPYVVVDRITSLRGAGDGAWLRDQYVDKYDQVRYKHEHRIGISITCYGENSDGILNQLRVASTDDWTRKELNESTGATFQLYSDIAEKPLFIETDFIDGAEMDAQFTAISDWTPPRGSSIIEKIEVSGDYENSTLTTDIVVDINEIN